MSAERASRTAWWRRWANLPVAVALLFAATVVGAIPPTARAALAVPALQAFVVPPPQAIGQRPNLHVDDQSEQDRGAPGLTVLAWLSAPAGLGAVVWWLPRHDSDGYQARARQGAHRVRGPPGRRAADASS